MTYLDFLKNKELQEAAAAYMARYGGRFVCEEPGTRLVYLDAEGNAYAGESTAKELIALLKSETVEDPLAAAWTNLEDEDVDPEILY